MRTESADASPDGGGLQVAPGEQVLAVYPSAGSLLDALPPAAFENLLVVSTNFDLGEVERAVTTHGGDPTETWVVPVGTGAPRGTTLRTTAHVTPSDLTGLSIRLSQRLDGLEPGEGWLVFDSLGMLLMYADRNRVARLLDWLAGSLRSRSARGVFGLAAGVTTEETRQSLAQALDRQLLLD